jgi:carboxymethylenebutenolidase
MLIQQCICRTEQRHLEGVTRVASATNFNDRRTFLIDEQLTHPQLAGRSNQSFPGQSLAVERLENEHFNRAARHTLEDQSSRKNFRFIHHEQVARPKDFDEIADYPVIGIQAPAIDKQSRGISRRCRRLRNAFVRQVVVEVQQTHARRLRHAKIPHMTNQETIRVGCDAGDMDMTVWTPASGSGPAILLIQEVFGVGPYITAVGERLAESGYVVGAPDIFWRFAPGWVSSHDQAGLKSSIEQAGKLDRDIAISDCSAALDALAALSSTVGTPGAIGFCLGGTLTFGLAIAAQPSVAVSYYGSGVPSMLDQIDQVACPILFHFGNADDFIPSEGVEALNSAMDGRPGFVLNVENAGHAFDNHESEMFYNEAAAHAAWAKTMAFFGEHLPLS